MSFFKGLKSMVSKNVTFHNLVKFGGQALSFIPGVGGVASGVVANLQDAHDAKKAGRQAEADALVQQATTAVADGAQTIGGQFLRQTMSKGYDALTPSVKAGAGDVGAAVADESIKSWFTKHWQVVAGGVAGFFALIYFVSHSGGSRGGHKVHYKH